MPATDDIKRVVGEYLAGIRVPAKLDSFVWNQGYSLMFVIKDDLNYLSDLSVITIDEMKDLADSIYCSNAHTIKLLLKYLEQVS